MASLTRLSLSAASWRSDTPIRPKYDEQMKKLPRHLETFWIGLAVTAVLIVVDYLRFGTIPELYDLRFSLGIIGFSLLFHFIEKK